MEQQSGTFLYQDLRDRLRDVQELVCAPNRAREKERRQYSTQNYPTFEIDYENCSTPRPTFINGTLRYSSVENCLVTLLTRSLDKVDYQLRIKPSKKVRSLLSSRTIFHELHRSIKSLEFCGTMGSLSQLFTLRGREREYAWAMSGTVSTNEYCKDLLGVLSGNKVWEESDWMLLQNKWTKPITCDLRTKFYPNRGDLRAFVSDKDDLRSLVGSIMHSLLHPSGNEKYSFAPYNSTYPKDKNILHDTIVASGDSTLVMAFGDVSSFTGSFKNIWYIFYGALRILEKHPQTAEPLIIDINGALLETTTLEVARLFMFLASAVIVRDRTELFCSMGGMLGVAGIDTIAKVIFGCFIRNLCLSLPRSVDFRPKIGGDDFVLRCFCDKYSNWASLLLKVKDEISKYIGHCKEFVVEPIPSAPCLHITTNRYCKKMIAIELSIDGCPPGMVRFRFQSQYRLPLYSALLDPEEYATTSSATQFWQETKNVPWVPDRLKIRSAIFKVVNEHCFDSLGLGRRDRVSLIYPAHENFVTANALNIVERIPTILDSHGNAYRLTFNAKLSSVVGGTLIRATINENGNKSLWLTVSEYCAPPVNKMDDQPLRDCSLPLALINELIKTKQLIEHANFV